MSTAQSKFRMVDVAAKREERREALATGKLKLKETTLDLMREGKTEKGDPFAAAEVAAILAAKGTSNIIPLCHPIPISEVKVAGNIVDDGVVVEASVRATAKTGVEMEALVAAAVYLLTVWDMTKQYEKDEEGQYPSTAIESIRVVRKVKSDVDK
jgi:cyclic pyranopterin phosphate synthase